MKRNKTILLIAIFCAGCTGGYNPDDNRYIDGYGVSMFMTTRGVNGAVLESHYPCGIFEETCAGPDVYFTWDALIAKYPNYKTRINKIRQKIDYENKITTNRQR